jgi:hypothetical protein
MDINATKQAKKEADVTPTTALTAVRSFRFGSFTK